MKFSNKSLVVLFVIFLTQGPCFLLGHVTTPPCYSIPEISKELEDNLFAKLTSTGPTTVTGYMNNCSNCKTFMKVLEKKVKEHPNMNIWIVDGQATKLHKKIEELSGFKIPGYPSTAFIKDGKIQNIQIGGDPEKFEKNIKKLLLKN